MFRFLWSNLCIGETRILSVFILNCTVKNCGGKYCIKFCLEIVKVEMIRKLITERCIKKLSGVRRLSSKPWKHANTPSWYLISRHALISFFFAID